METFSLAGLSLPTVVSWLVHVCRCLVYCRYTFLLDIALNHNQPMLMVGPTGTGKSVYINRYLVLRPSWRFLDAHLHNFLNSYISEYDLGTGGCASRPTLKRCFWTTRWKEMCHICGWFEHASERDVWGTTPGGNIVPAFVHFSRDAWMAKANWIDNRGSMEGCCIGLSTIQESLDGAKVRTWAQNETRNKNSILAIHSHVGIKFSISCHLGGGASMEAGS